MKIYSAETGELQYDSNNPDGGDHVNQDIKKDYSSRVFIHFKPGEMIRFYFTAKRKSPEQFYAEHETEGDSIDLSEFVKELKDTLDHLGWQLMRSEDSKVVIEHLENPEPEIPDFRDIYEEQGFRNEIEEGRFSVSVPSLSQAMKLFNHTIHETPYRGRSVMVCEDSALEHRENPDIFIKRSRMSGEMEPIRETREKIEEKIKNDNLNRCIDALRRTDNREIELGFRNTSLSDRLGFVIYPKTALDRHARTWGFTTFLLFAVTGGAALSLLTPQVSDSLTSRMSFAPIYSWQILAGCVLAVGLAFFHRIAGVLKPVLSRFRRTSLRQYGRLRSFSTAADKLTQIDDTESIERETYDEIHPSRTDSISPTPRNTEAR